MGKVYGMGERVNHALANRILLEHTRFSNLTARIKRSKSNIAILVVFAQIKTFTFL
jgi:hypothetical protein